MIRFCDSNMKCIEYGSLNRNEILSYFLSNHLDEIVYVCEDLNSKRFIGIITYDLLCDSDSVDRAIQKDYVILDANIWQSARIIFARRNRDILKYTILPVLNERYQIVCFAYQDEYANREIRMLRELQENQSALQFGNLYSKYKCVKIHAFNELAFFFAHYLIGQNVAVEVEGTMWKDFWGGGMRSNVLECECMNIYAEGSETIKCDRKRNPLVSVSAEFECIDKIYEANIKCGNIKDAAGDFSWFIEKIKDEKEIVIIGTGIYALNAYDLLLAKGIDILCFMSEDQRDWKRKLFGKNILPREKIVNSTKKPIFVEVYYENSAWGFGEIDRYDYEGYRRNEQIFFLKDYSEIVIGKLQNILKGKNVVLVGNTNLCSNVKHALEDVGCQSVNYWEVLEKKSIKESMDVSINKNSIKDVVGLIIEPKYFCNTDFRHKMSERKRLYYEKLEEKGICDISQYFSESEVLVSIQQTDVEKYSIPCLKPGKILLNISGHMCGNEFFGNLLDGHPKVVQIDWGIENVQSNLFLICIQLAEENALNILHAFWAIYNAITSSETKVFAHRKEKFNEKLKELLICKDSFTSQELFVMLHIAYAEAWGQKVSDIQEMLIYHEQREETAIGRPLYEKWLCDDKVRGFSINITRNAYTRVGSLFKHLENFQNFTYSKIESMWGHMSYSAVDREQPRGWERFEVKFETIKTSPKATLTKICDRIGLLWDDHLLVTSYRGRIAEYQSGNEKIKDFDLRPVYNLYEEYFSDFDRFRINMIFSREQKRFGYPYTSCRDFSARQLQEMFLKEFRFESRLPYADDYGNIFYRKNFVDKVDEYLRREYMNEILQENVKDERNNG